MSKFVQSLKTSIGLQIAALLVSASLFFIGGAVSSAKGDCKPHERDGQCGLSTFLGAVYGAAGALVIVAVGGIAVGIAASRRTGKQVA